MYSSTELDPERMIAAIASPAGAGGRGIIRLSGLETLAVLRQLLNQVEGSIELDEVRARRYEASIPFGKTGVPLSVDVYLWPGERSYTGQPTAEIHTIGSPPILESLLEQLYQLGVKPARPGEFTMRSVLAGKMSLLQAEAVIGVIDADSEQELEQALSQLAGGISTSMRTMRDELLSDLADLEAGLDFVDEDIDFVQREEFLRRLQNIEAELHDLSAAAEDRMLNRVQFRVVLAGLPNAGKSTLFNRLTGQQALVSDIEGTTTDYLTASVEHNGLQLLFLDTAGWEQGATEILQAAQIHREEQSTGADLLLWCTPANTSGVTAERDEQLYQDLQQRGLPVQRILTKADLAAREQSSDQLEVSPDGSLEPLWDLIAERYGKHSAHKTELLASSAARCRDALTRAWQQIQAARMQAEMGGGDELIAEEIRGALREFGMILGQVHTDDLLDIVFSRFCIGK